MSLNPKPSLSLRSDLLKEHINKYTILGLSIALASIFFATFMVSYQLTGAISLHGLIQAQITNPAIWALDLSPFLFAYWGQSFCSELVNKAELIIDDKTRKFIVKNDDLALKLQFECNHDSLTNLPNYRLLLQRINQGIQQIDAGELLAVVVISINDFKEINYNFGNFTGNSLLIQFAEKLKSILLEPYMLQVYMGMNMVARLQSAEFAVLIPRLKKQHNLDEILAKFVEETSVRFLIDGHAIDIKTKAGAAVYPQHGENDQALIHHATLCLLHAEKEGFPYALYDPCMDKHYKTKGLKLNELSQAIERQEISVLLQPIYKLVTDELVGFEAVMCFEDAEFGLVGAEQFLPLIAGTPLVDKLTEFGLKKVIEQLSLWHKAGHEIYARVYLINSLDRELPNILKNFLQEHDLKAEYLKIEVTEKACLHDQSYSLNVLNRLVEQGIKISISDFGSGYSSFTYVANFPISEIKIDQSFVSQMMSDQKKHVIVEAIIKLAEVFGFDVFAEGINDELTRNELKRLGCTYGEGDYYSPPTEPAKFELFFKKI